MQLVQGLVVEKENSLEAPVVSFSAAKPTSKRKRVSPEAGTAKFKAGSSRSASAANLLLGDEPYWKHMGGGIQIIDQEHPLVHLPVNINEPG